MIAKIKKDIFERSRVKNIGYFPQTGNSQQEYDYRYVKSDVEGLEDYYFVVSKVLKYRANSIDGMEFKVYAYDKNGEFTDNPDIMKKCRGGFFETIKDIE
jgi:hypothetical protein